MVNKNIKLDVLAFGAHPDDVEACSSGLLITYARQGKKVGIIDMSQSELSTNGTVPNRMREAAEAAKIIGAVVRENLKLPNNFFFNSKEVQKKIIHVIRTYRPEMVLLPYWVDRHPDHAEASNLVLPALFTSGLIKFRDGLPPHRPKYVFFYKTWWNFQPSFIFDITDVFEAKMQAIHAYQSQLVAKKGSRPTRDNEEGFMDYWQARHRTDGYEIRVKYGEPYLSLTPLGVKDISAFLPNFT